MKEHHLWVGAVSGISAGRAAQLTMGTEHDGAADIADDFRVECRALIRFEN